MLQTLITGANGQLGSEIKALHRDFPAIDFMFTDVDDLDITSTENIRRFYENTPFKLIINCAAYTAVDKAEEDQEAAFEINSHAVKNLATFANKNNIKFIHTSTDYVFDGTKYRPYVETDEPNPESVYGRSKLTGETAARGMKQHLITRTSWLYSAHGHNFVKTMMRLGKEKESLNVIYDQVGTPTYAGDLAHAILKIASRYAEKKEFHPGIYHYSNEGVCSWYDFAKEIMDICGFNCKINPITTEEYPQAAKRPFYSVMDKQKIKKQYEIEIPHWKDSLKKCIQIINH